MSGTNSGLIEYQKALGDRVRRMRRDRSLTQLDLAEQVGVTNGQISTIERGLSAPSIGTLRRIAQALGVPVVAFFDSPARTEVNIVRVGERQRVISPGSLDAMEVLAGSSLIHARQVEVEPEHFCERCGDPNTSEVFLFVLQGHLELTCNDKTFLLATGDSAQADGSQARAYRNIGESRMLVLEVLGSYPGGSAGSAV